MAKPERRRGSGVGGGWILLGLILIGAIFFLAGKLSDRDRPSIQLQRPVKGIGQTTTFEFEVSDRRHRIKRMEVELRQGDRLFRIPFAGIAETMVARSRLGFERVVHGSNWTFTAHLGKKEIPELQEGRATLHIAVTNDSWGHFFHGGRSEMSMDLPVRLAPPQVEVLTPQHYINQGGAEMVMIKVSPAVAESGVQVGKYFFPSFPVREASPEVRLCLFALPYDQDAETPMRVIARDDAGNETQAQFTYRVFAKKFHSDTINVSDQFMQSVVPPIMSQTPEMKDQGSLLKNFLMLNGQLRQADAQQLVDLSKKTASHFLWTEPFIALPSKVEASFADYRTYVYQGQVVDHQTHLGFDLAGLLRMPIQAANDGIVDFAGFLGIYGNAVIIDHGCGLQTLYGHLSSIRVKAGDAVKRGQEIGRSGQTGLAGGDHLHFTVLLDGIPVNPVEWWDPHWIHDRIEAKLAQYR